MSEGSGVVSKRELIARAQRVFQDHFGREATWVGVAPGRVNLMGDHVDYAGGLVLPMAIDRWTVAAGDWSADPNRATLYAADLGETAELDLSAGIDDDAKHVLGASVGHWSGYVAGVFTNVRHMGEMGRAAPGVDLAVTSTVPRASGLSSSAALELAVATLLDHAWNQHGSGAGLARACQRAEHEGGGVQCGPMDQLACALGVAGQAIMLDCSDLSVRPAPIAPTLAVLVVDTRTPRQLAQGKYSDLLARMQKVERTFGPSLRGLTIDHVRASDLAPDIRASAEHYVEETARVHHAAAHLASGDARELARVMLASHASLRDRLGVSCPELEAAVAAAGPCGPDVGARLTGAGMGGCAVVVCPRNQADLVGAGVRDRFVATIGRSCDVLHVEAVDGAGVAI